MNLAGKDLREADLQNTTSKSDEHKGRYGSLRMSQQLDGAGAISNSLALPVSKRQSEDDLLTNAER